MIYNFLKYFQMKISNFRVFITSSGNGAIDFLFNNENYRVQIPKDKELLFKIFVKYFNELENLKNRHSALAKWIVEEIRNEGYSFKLNPERKEYIPIYTGFKFDSEKSELIQIRALYFYKQQISEIEVSDFERLTH